MDTKKILNRSLLAGSLIGLGALQVNAAEINITTLGSGGEVRSALLGSARTLDNAIELTCGEGEKKEATTKTETKKESKAEEHKCGEGKCGEAKGEKSEQKEEAASEAKPEGSKKESKAEEHKCGEGKCGM